MIQTMLIRCCWTLFLVVCFCRSCTDLTAADPLPPKQELATFQVHPGFKVELVASEPDVVDPVAMAFDERGRMFVCEMRGYPNGGVGTGVQNKGRVRLLTDADGDGLYEKSQIYADSLRFPTGVLPWKNGVIVTVAPDILYLQDTNDDGIADQKTVLYTGFGLSNIQQMVNSPVWGIDHWVYCVNGSVGGEISSPQQPDMKPVTLRGRGLRFKPDVPGSLEPMSGGGQYGLTCDEAQHWFVNTNSQHLRQIVLPDHYLRRNPYLSVPAVSADIPEHGAACKVYRVSPFEAWRVERTTRRKDSPDAKRFSPTELVPGGYVTSGCSPLYYNDPLYPMPYRSNVFLCDPANNLVMRDALEPNGSLYKATRPDREKEFFASTDNWCRPVSISIGPDGAMYLLDFYREVIETPLSLPDDIKKKLNLESRERGRIWRIVPQDYTKPTPVALHKASDAELGLLLDSPNVWQRTTAQRLLHQRAAKAIGPTLATLWAKASPSGRGHLLWTMHHFKTLETSHVLQALRDPTPSVREHTLRVAESFTTDATVRQQVSSMTNDASSFVRLQLALTAGSFAPDDAGPMLAKLLQRSDGDAWMQSAILSSAKEAAPSLVEQLAQAPEATATTPALIARFASLIGAQGNMANIAHLLKKLPTIKSQQGQAAILEGLGQGMQNSKTPLNSVWRNPPAELKDAVTTALPLFQQAAQRSADIKEPLLARQAAARLLMYAPYPVAKEPLQGLLSPQTPAELQSTALRALASFSDPSVADILLANWSGYSPSLRKEAVEALFARKDRLTKLLDALEAKKIAPAHIEVARAEELRKHTDPVIRQRATTLLATQVAADRKKVIDRYKPALELKADVARGRDVFRKNCTACHRLENTGYEVGADLNAALRNKTKEALLIDIFDPNREVDARFINYQVTTTAARSVTGILAVETPTSIILRRGEKLDDTILRTQIDEIRATNKSLMPEEFEKQLEPQQLADLLEYLLSQR